MFVFLISYLPVKDWFLIIKSLQSPRLVHSFKPKPAVFARNCVIAQLTFSEILRIPQQYKIRLIFSCNFTIACLAQIQTEYG